MRALRQRIERLVGWYPELFLEPHLVAAVAVLSDYSGSPARFNVRSDYMRSITAAEQDVCLDLSWSHPLEAKAKRLRATIQRRPLVEMAATAIALSVARRFLNLGALDVTSYGDRADYRSLRRRRVLEISGTEVVSEFERRQREKAAQALANPFGWDAYVVVCLFSAKGHRIRLSQHKQSEDGHE